ncbi:hypothetical protein EJB05_39719, partial [Eragrostis curvula]
MCSFVSFRVLNKLTSPNEAGEWGWQHELIEPAGTVKRVILTSSAAAVSRARLQGDGHVLDERSPGPTLSSSEPTSHRCGYVTSLARSHVRQSKSTVGAAPVPNAVTSVPNCLSLLSGDEAEFAVLRGIERSSGTVALVHVDDVCRAELFLAEEEAAAGRYLCCSLNTTVVQLARFLTDKYPRNPVKTNLLSGSGELLEKPRVCLSSAKLVREGFVYEYKTLDRIYDDVVEYGKVLGILPT